MTALRRGWCPDCGSDVALRKGDLVREHRVPVPRERFRDPHNRVSDMPVCSGSGKEAIAPGTVPG